MPRRRDSRALILRAACAEFGAHGYAGARVARVAATAKVNKQLIFYYFRSKAGLYAAATAADYPSSGPDPAGLPTPMEGFRADINRLATYLADHPELTTALADREAAMQPTVPGRELVERFVRSIAATVSRGQGMGYFRDDLDPMLAARQTVVLLAGFYALAPQMRDGGDARTWSLAASDLLLRAFAW